MSALRALSFALLLLVPHLASAQLRLTLDELPTGSALLDQPSAPALTLDHRTPRSARILLEAAGGLGGGLAFGAATGFAGLLIACPSGLKPSPSCLRGIGWGALAGVALATPPGVFLTGHLLKGGGSFLPTLGGGLLGVGAVLLLAPYAAGILPLLVFGLPAIGSVAAYELSATLHRHQLEPPEVTPGEAGGAPAMTVVARF